jgi:hypothetical protein
MASDSRSASAASNRGWHHSHEHDYVRDLAAEEREARLQEQEDYDNREKPEYGWEEETGYAA